METFGIAMLVQEERNRLNERINRESWMLGSLEGRSRGKFKEALTRRVRRSGEC